MNQTMWWVLGVLVLLVLGLGAAVVVLGVRLREAANHPIHPPVPEMSAEAERAAIRREVMLEAQELLNGTMRRLLAPANNAAERMQELQRTFGADVLAVAQPIDQQIAQVQRYVQEVGVLCGSPPGQQRSPQLLGRVVGAAQSRIHDYNRVRLVAPDTTTAVLGRVVEPLSMALAVLLDNAARSSPPTADVDVVITAEYHGVSITVLDGGVGMPPDALARANTILSRGETEIEFVELGNPPQLGFAVCGVLAARYGFSASLDTASGRGGMRAVLLVPRALLTTLDPEPAPPDNEPATEPAAPASDEPHPSWPGEPAAEPAATTPSGLPKRQRTVSRSGDLATAPGGTTAAPPAAERPQDPMENLRALQRATGRTRRDEGR